MSQPFLGEIRIFAGNFAPKNWALCDGQLLAISQNTALFSILGTTYGGNGTTNFGLPNLQGSAPLHRGNGAGLSPRVLGETGGEQAVTLQPGQMPAHSHVVQCSNAAGTQVSPAGAVWAMTTTRRGSVNAYAPTSANTTPMAQLPFAGSNAPHNNMPPYLTMNFIIALQGVFPSRN